MTTDTLFEALGHLRLAHLGVLAELDQHPHSYALSDACNMIADTMSQVRGEIAARKPERPILDQDRGAA